MLFADLALAVRIEAVAARVCRECTLALARLRPDSGATTIDVAGGIACFAGIGSPMTQAMGLGLDGPVSAADLDRLEALYFDRGSPVQVVTCPLADPSLAALLGSRGYRPVEFENILYLPLDPSAPSPSPPPGITARPIFPSEADAWADAISEGFAGMPGVPPELREIALMILGTTGATHFLALADGTPAGGGTLFADAAVAFLAGSATRPAHRNRGIQTAMLHARLAQARRHDCDLAVMGSLPGSGSQRNVERLGFRVAYTRVAFLKDSAEVATS
jgi:GNAT superfamily N-acetyltransferase